MSPGISILDGIHNNLPAPMNYIENEIWQATEKVCQANLQEFLDSSFQPVKELLEMLEPCGIGVAW